MKPQFVPDFSQYNKMYFPDSEVVNDLAVAKRIDGEALKQHIEFNGRQSIVSMRQFDDEKIQHIAAVPRSVQTPVEMNQYLKSLKREIKSSQRDIMSQKLQNSLLKFISE